MGALIGALFGALFGGGADFGEEPDAVAICDGEGWEEFSAEPQSRTPD